MNIIVTGGAGFIGSHIVDSLVEQNHRVIVMDNLSSGDLDNVNPKAEFYLEDVNQFDSFCEGLFRRKQGIDLVIHCAAQVDVLESINDTVKDAQENIMNSLKLLDSLSSNKRIKFLFISTGGAIYGDGASIPTKETEVANPISPYGISKLTVENYIGYYREFYGMNICTLRLANVYGDRNDRGVIPRFIDQIRRGDMVQLNGGKQTRDFIHVSDVVGAVEVVIEKDLSGTYNVSTGDETNILYLAEKIIELLGRGEINRRTHLEGEVNRSCLDSSKLQVEGWFPKIKLDEGLRMCL